MERELGLKLLKQSLELREARTTTLSADVYREPTVNYTDLDRFERELNALFRGRPQVVGLSCDLPRTGSYFTTNLAEVPVLAVRGEDGFVQAYLNACRHRGASVASGRGHLGRTFKCPYHAWIYDINGRLLGQPSAGTAFAGVDAGCTGLVPLPASESSGIVYVSPSIDAGPIDAEKELAGLGPTLSGVGFEDFVLFDEQRSTWTMNWKQPYDTFLEAYHIFSLHKESLSKETLSTPMLSESFGPHSRGVVLQREAIKLLTRPEDEWTLRNNANVFFALFPNSILNLPAPGHAELWQFFPDGARVDRTRVHVRFYTHGEPASANQRAFYERMIQFTTSFVAEDFRQQEDIYFNLKSGLLTEMIYGRNEPALSHFHRMLDVVLKP